MITRKDFQALALQNQYKTLTLTSKDMRKKIKQDLLIRVGQLLDTYPDEYFLEGGMKNLSFNFTIVDAEDDTGVSP